MRFGWCMDGHHASCPHHIPQQPRLVCDCPCHAEETPAP